MVEIFSGGNMFKTSPPPLRFFFKLKRYKEKRLGGGGYLLTYFSGLRFFREGLRFSGVVSRYFQEGLRNFQGGLINFQKN